MTDIGPKDVIRVRSHHPSLANELCLIQRISSTKKTLVATHDVAGIVSLKFSDVEVISDLEIGRVTPITLDDIVAKIKRLIGKYLQMNGTIDRPFVEHLFGESVEDLFKTPDMVELDNKSSTENVDKSDNKCSTDEGEKISDRVNIPSKKWAGRPPCQPNMSPPSGWLDPRELVNGTTSFFFCRYEMVKRVKKTKIPKRKLEAVASMINSKYPANQIEDFIQESGVIF